MLIEIDKFQFVKEHLIKNNLKTILDVGCRDCILKKYVNEVVDKYKGCDLFQNDEKNVDYVLNVENGLPIGDNAFDCVVALDLIEHLDGFQEGIEELLRVTKNDLILALPNISNLFFRIKFLFTGNISGKYSLNISNATKGSDRHRWFTTRSETDKYMEEFTSTRSLKLLKYDYVGNGKKMKFFARVGKFLRLPKSLYSWSEIYILRKYE